MMLSVVELPVCRARMIGLYIAVTTVVGIQASATITRSLTGYEPGLAHVTAQGVVWEGSGVAPRDQCKGGISQDSEASGIAAWIPMTLKY
jgi:hypothetical protein